MAATHDQLNFSNPQFSIMAINNPCCYPLLDGDSHSFGLFNPDMSLAPFYSSDMSSSGYLQDAIIEWSDRCKQRKVLVFPQQDHSPTMKISENLLQSYWTWNYYGFPPSNFSWLNRDNNLSPDEALNSTLSSIINGAGSMAETKTKEPTPVEEQEEKESSVSEDHAFTVEKRRRRKLAMGVAYPFAVVKPSGVEGDVTLNDINKRILKRPNRPIQHPVGDFARLPCASANGSGPSGKAVVALTKIQTQGRGTITIIRTRG